MTGTLRKTARNPFGIALMGGLILVFLILGIGGGGRFPDMFRSVNADTVVSAGAHQTSSRDFLRIFEQEKQRLEQQSGKTYDNTFLAQNGFDQQLLSQIAQDDAFAEVIARMGIVPAPDLVDAQIRKLSFAFDRVTGQFSEKQYIQALAQQGLTPRQAQADLTDELADRHLILALQAGFNLPASYAALNAIQGLETRDVSYFNLDARAVPAPGTPTDADLTAFIKEHAAQLMQPEMRLITLVRFSAKDLAPNEKIDPASVAKAFDDEKATLATPETRTVAQIPVTSTPQAAAIAAKLRAGGDPDAVARAAGIQYIHYDDKPQSVIPDRKVAAVAFSLKPGEVAGPIQGDLGLSVVKVLKVTAPTQPNLQSARAKLEGELRDKAARDQAYKMSQAFDDAKQGGASLADAARKAGVAPVTIGPVRATGQDSTGKVDPRLTPEMLKSAFSRGSGEESDIEDAGSGEYYALKVEKIIPPSLPGINDQRADLIRAWTNQRYITALKAKAAALVAAIKKGEPIAKAAAENGATLQHQAGMQRIHAQQYTALGNEFLGEIFGGKAGDVFAAGAPNGAFIARLDGVRPGDLNNTAMIAEAIRPRLAEGYLRDLVEAMKTAARGQVKVTENLTLARQAINVDPAALAKPGKAGAAQ